MRPYASLSFILLIFISCTSQQKFPSQTEAEQAVMTLERQTLDRWSSGDPMGFAEMAADDVTYFEDGATEARLDGLEEFRNYLKSLEGQIPPHTYELVDTKVQVYGDIAISTLQYVPIIGDKRETPWKGTDVYRLIDGEWRLVHAHWSTVEQP